MADEALSVWKEDALSYSNLPCDTSKGKVAECLYLARNLMEIDVCMSGEQSCRLDQPISCSFPVDLSIWGACKDPLLTLLPASISGPRPSFPSTMHFWLPFKHPLLVLSQHPFLTSLLTCT